jgi:hypothetical protein
VAGHVSRKLAVSVEVLRAQRARTGLDWGDLLIANPQALRAAPLRGSRKSQQLQWVVDLPIHPHVRVANGGRGLEDNHSISASDLGRIRKLLT